MCMTKVKLSWKAKLKQTQKNQAHGYILKYRDLSILKSEEMKLLCLKSSQQYFAHVRKEVRKF